MPKGIRETQYHIMVVGDSRSPKPLEVVKISRTPEYRKWSLAHGLHLATDLTNTGDMYGRLRDGRLCVVVKGKTVVPTSALT